MTGWGWAFLLLAVASATLAVWRWQSAERSRKEVEEKCRQTQEEARISRVLCGRYDRYLQALDIITSHPLFLVDEARTILWSNQAAREVCTTEVEAGVPLANATDLYELIELVDAAWKDDLPHERQMSKGGAVYYAVARRLAGDPPLVALRLRDVTELQRLGRARRDFVANISHDLRTPIAAIQVMVETLQGTANLSEKRRRKLLAGIADQTETLQHLAQEMLDLSLIESGRMPLRLVSTPVEALIMPVVQRMQTQAEHKEIDIELDIRARRQALADVENVQRVLQNLLHNAIKFSPAGSKVLVGAVDVKDEVRLFVQDNGPGIAPEDIDRIFERFYKGDRTRSRSGTGLGLAIARHIVEGHGGRIWVESEYGEGATFYFSLLVG
ncbi:MAG: hypothetical protein D6775_10000 [Caldilineae bacterium]|nr:MAG: hypothetical protein D6775_10000 [Caldilineae bacterium]